jgi:hypothetical protein
MGAQGPPQSSRGRGGWFTDPAGPRRLPDDGAEAWRMMQKQGYESGDQGGDGASPARRRRLPSGWTSTEVAGGTPARLWLKGCHALRQRSWLPSRGCLESESTEPVSVQPAHGRVGRRARSRGHAHAAARTPHGLAPASGAARNRWRILTALSPIVSSSSSAAFFAIRAHGALALLSTRTRPVALPPRISHRASVVAG